MTHTPECAAARGGPDSWPTVFALLTQGGDELVAVVKACPHPAHDTLRFLVSGPVDPRPPAPIPTRWRR